MTSASVEHVPATYRALDLGAATFWAKNESATWSEQLFSITRLVESAIVSVADLLAFVPTRRVHVVVYADTEDSFAALERRVPPTFLLAPLHASTHAVVVLHSVEADSRNGDFPRLRRHLCHEVAHVIAAERTGSFKRLGDGNRDMRMRSWVNEGFAECVAGLASKQLEVMQHALRMASGTMMSLRGIDAKLDDVLCPERSLAFAIATTAVWRGIEAQGLPFVFAHLDEPALWCAEARSDGDRA